MFLTASLPPNPPPSPPHARRAPTPAPPRGATSLKTPPPPYARHAPAEPWRSSITREAPNGSRQAQALALLFLQHAAQDLARRRLRDRLDELKLVQGLVARQAPARPREQRVGGEGGVLAHHERLRQLARLGIGLADHRAV